MGPEGVRRACRVRGRHPTPRVARIPSQRRREVRGAVFGATHHIEAPVGAEAGGGERTRLRQLSCMPPSPLRAGQVDDLDRVVIGETTAIWEPRFEPRFETRFERTRELMPQQRRAGKELDQHAGVQRVSSSAGRGAWGLGRGASMASRWPRRAGLRTSADCVERACLRVAKRVRAAWLAHLRKRVPDTIS